MSKNVDLGFFNGDFPAWDLEKDFEDFELCSRFFPSKVGGRPAWLDLANLPKPSTTQCKKCGNGMRFLLQVYSPDDGTESAFHRTIFVFICVQNQCWSDSTESGKPIVVLRSQLGRKNQFYPFEPPVDRPDWRPDIVPENFGSICPVCGIRGDKTCGRCRSVSYCSQIHQKLDWKKGHKAECQVGGKYGGPHASDVFPEGLIEIEEEPSEEELHQESMDYSNLIDPSISIEDTKDVPAEEWDEVEANQTHDKASEKFNKRIRRAPRQIIRHNRSGEPLICSGTVPIPEPPKCAACGAQRSFEFQIMPQLLNILGLGTDIEGGVDWASIYIFTCSRSCGIEGYVEESWTVLNFDASDLPI
eukprot:TRINITY_DN5247_c0_g1_i1.p1 TRINITY_DN5247_c0_g1~~TRINITY_DN5247_c0_g1_i1.p1  ORF type:complete len:359 (+),score=42.81 TRINITY_DN5247_c0_g1_i1:37-1113(+)